MSITFNTKTYQNNLFTPTSVAYIGPAKTVIVKDDLRLAMTLAKPTEVYSGMSRTQAKLTRSHTLTGAKTSSGDSFVEINVGVSVGTASADVDALLNDAGALLSGADFKTHVKSQKVNF